MSSAESTTLIPGTDAVSNSSIVSSLTDTLVSSSASAAVPTTTDGAVASTTSSAKATTTTDATPTTSTVEPTTTSVEPTTTSTPEAATTTSTTSSSTSAPVETPTSTTETTPTTTAQPTTSTTETTPTVTPSTLTTTSTTEAPVPTTPTTTSTTTPAATTPSTTTSATETTPTTTSTTDSTQSRSTLVTYITTTEPGGAVSTSTTSSSVSAATSSGSSSSGGGSGGLSDGAKIAIAVVIPVAAIAAIIAVGLWWWKRRKANQMAEEERRKEVEDYSYNPNGDPAVGGGMVTDGAYEMRQEPNVGYRGWGTTTVGSTGRKASTQLSGPIAYSEGTATSHGVPVSDARSGDRLIESQTGSYSPDGEILGAMGAGGQHQGGDVHRGLSNASSTYSTAGRSEGSNEGGGIGVAYSSGNGGNPVINVNNQYYEQYGTANPYDAQYGNDGYGANGGLQPAEVPGQPVIRDNPARRNTRIESPSHFPQQSAGISQNF